MGQASKESVETGQRAEATIIGVLKVEEQELNGFADNDADAKER